MIEKESKSESDQKKELMNEEKVHILVHEMLHDLIVILNTQPREIGAMAMIELLVTHSPFKEKQDFLDYISKIWDAWNEENKNDK